MKTLYSHRRNNGPAIIAGSILGVVLLVFVGIRLVAPNVFFALVSPLMRGGSSVTASVGATVTSVQDASQLAKDNQALQQEVLELQNENHVLTARAQDLTKLLGGSIDTAQGTPAGVISRPPESPYDTLLIGAGSVQGIAVGHEVFAQGGIPVGTISSVANSTAQVRLFSSVGQTTSGWIGADRVPVSLAGAGAGAFSATLAKGATIATGDFVYLPGPGAVPVGTIVRIDTDPSSPTEVVHIQPHVNIFSLTWVEVGKSAP